MNSREICNNPNLTPEEKWRLLYGTDNVGNLPEYKKTQHEGHCWMPCPYDTRVSDSKTRFMLKISSSSPLPSKVEHTDVNGKEYYMKTANRGEWGYSCTFPGCPFYIDHGIPYFYR